MNQGQIDNISQNGDAHKITSLYMSIYTGFYRSKKCNVSFGPEYRDENVSLEATDEKSVSLT